MYYWPLNTGAFIFSVVKFLTAYLWNKGFHQLWKSYNEICFTSINFFWQEFMYNDCTQGLFRDFFTWKYL